MIGASGRLEIGLKFDQNHEGESYNSTLNFVLYTQFLWEYFSYLFTRNPILKVVKL